MYKRGLLCCRLTLNRAMREASSRIFEDEARAEKAAERKAKRATRAPKAEEAPAALNAPLEKTTLGDLEALAALKEKLANDEK